LAYHYYVHLVIERYLTQILDGEPAMVFLEHMRLILGYYLEITGHNHCIPHSSQFSILNHLQRSHTESQSTINQITSEV